MASLFRRWWWHACSPVFVLAFVRAAEPIPVADFARAPACARMQLSPDGKYVGFLAEFGGRRHICVQEIGRPEIIRFQIGTARAFGTEVAKEVRSFLWINEHRLAVTTTVWDAFYGVAAMNRDGREWVGLSGGEADPTGRTRLLATDIIHRFTEGDPAVLMLDRRDSLGAVHLFPHVVRVNAATGIPRQVVKNPGNVVSWDVDQAGVVRLGIVYEGDESSVLYRDSEDAPWRTLPLPRGGRDKLRALGFDPTNGTFYVAGLTAEDRWTALPFDLATGKVGEPLFSDPVYDIVPERAHPLVPSWDVATKLWQDIKAAHKQYLPQFGG